MPEYNHDDEAITVKAKLHNEDQGQWMFSETETTERGISIAIKQKLTDIFAWADIHIEVYEGNLAIYIWEPDDVQNDPTVTVKIPMDTALKWSRETGEDI